MPKQINQVTIPDQGSTKEFIADKIGGWMYEVTTIVTVNQYRLDEHKEKLRLAQETLAKVQQEIAELQANDPDKV